MQTTSDTSQPVGTAPPFNAVDGALPADSEQPLTETLDGGEQALTSEVDTSGVDAAESKAQEEARKHGWVDQSEWRGPAERWRPASEFLEVRNNVLSIARQENQDLRAKLAAIEMKQNERDRREQEAQTKLQRESLRLQLKEARDNSDWDKVDEITEKLIDGKIATVAAPQAKGPVIDPVVRETFNAYTAQNKWLIDDKPLAANFAIELKAVVEAGAAPDMISAMNVAKERVMRLYPEKFRNGTRRTTSMVDMGGTPGGTTNGRGWSDLLPSVREQAEKDIAAKRYTKEDFLSNCEPEHFRR